MPAAEEVEDNLGQRRMEKSEEFETLGMWWNSRKGKKAPAARDADLSTGTTKVNAMNHVKFVRRVQIREDRRDGFVQSSKRKTCKRLEIDECESDQQV